MKRTPFNCSLIKKMEKDIYIGAPIIVNNTCCGYQKSEIDDEPCEICKKCKCLNDNVMEEGE